MVIKTILERKGLFSLILFFVLGSCFAQVSFEASAPKAIPLNEQFQITFTVQNAYGEGFKSPTFEGLNVLYPPANSVSQLNINGRKSMTFTGTFMGQKVGKVKIASASVRVKGKTYHTRPFSINILPESKEANNTSYSRGKTRINSTDIFIRVIPSKTIVYEQEALLLTFKLYSNTQRITFEEIKFPEFDGFIEEDLPLDHSITLEFEHYKGKNYFTGIIKRSLIFPQRVGNLIVPKGQFNLRVTDESSFEDEDDFFNFSTPTQYNKAISSPELIITSKALPSTHPNSFQNAVGDFDISLKTDNTKNLKTNDVITLKLSVKGKGNIKLLSAPQVDFPESFETYEPKSNTEVSSSSEGSVGTKIFEYNIIPRNKGSFDIPPIKFTYFDPVKKRFITKETKPLTLNIKQGDKDAILNKDEITLLGNDIAYLLSYDKAKDASVNLFIFSWYSYIPYGLILLIGILLGLFYIKYKKQEADIIGTKRRLASKKVRKHFKEIESLVTAGEENLFYNKLPMVVYAYLSDKFTFPIHQLSQQNIGKALLEKGLSSEEVNKLLNLLHKIDAAAFSNKEKRPSCKELLEETINIINDLDKATIK